MKQKSSLVLFTNLKFKFHSIFERSKKESPSFEQNVKWLYYILSKLKTPFKIFKKKEKINSRSKKSQKKDCLNCEAMIPL